MTESTVSKLHLMKAHSFQCIKSLKTYHYALSPTSKKESRSCLTCVNACVSSVPRKTDWKKHTQGRRRGLTRSSWPTNPLTFDLHLVLVSGPNHPDLIITPGPAAAGTFRPPRGWGSDHLPPVQYSSFDSHQSPAGTIALQGCVTGEEEPRVVHVYVCAVVDGWIHWRRV